MRVFAEIIPGKLYHSSCPWEAIEYVQEDFNINVVVDLAGASNFYFKFMKEGSILIRFPIRDYDVPSRRPFKKLIQRLVKLYNEENRVILIHCMGGRGRSTIGTACLYAVLNGLNGYQGIEHIGDKTGMNVPENQEQVDFINRFVRKYGEIEKEDEEFKIQEIIIEKVEEEKKEKND